MSPATAHEPQLRMRVFAGPNGSGKSTIIHAVRNTTIAGRKLDVGYYINADDIAGKLQTNSFNFSEYKLEIKRKELIEFAKSTGLLSERFSAEVFSGSFKLSGPHLILKNLSYKDQTAQLLARFLRQKMLLLGRRFSFETVFSHPSNLGIMQEAVAQGYKVYLYYVSTEDPEINKYRVNLRVTQGGHSVPEDKIASRYYRSMKLLKQALSLSYQAYCFDNSVDGAPYRLVGHGKRDADGTFKWDDFHNMPTAIWFNKYSGVKR